MIYLSLQGARLDQARVAELAQRERLILLSGRYEGVDERVLQHEVDEELSIGDYVLSGGELAAAVVIDAIGRLQEGALNDVQSAEQDSFSGRSARLPALHAAGAPRIGCVLEVSDLKRPCGNPPLAPETGLGTHLATPAGPAGQVRAESRRSKLCLNFNKIRNFNKNRPQIDRNISVL